MASAVDEPDLARLYRDTRARITALVSTLSDDALATAVPACPKWTVQDVLSHLFGIVDDALAGRLSGPPSEDETAVQVDRHRDLAIADLLEQWTTLGPTFESVLNVTKTWPAVIDIASHEQDIRGALNLPGHRDNEAIRLCSERLLRGLQSPVPLRITVEDAEFRVGPEEGTELRLATTRFEAFRWRLGRRSRAQLAAMDWSGDPAPVLDHLTRFEPATEDIIE